MQPQSPGNTHPLRQSAPTYALPWTDERKISESHVEESVVCMVLQRVAARQLLPTNVLL